MEYKHIEDLFDIKGSRVRITGGNQAELVGREGIFRYIDLSREEPMIQVRLGNGKRCLLRPSEVEVVQPKAQSVDHREELEIPGPPSQYRSRHNKRT